MCAHFSMYNFRVSVNAFSSKYNEKKNKAFPSFFFIFYAATIKITCTCFGKFFVLFSIHCCQFLMRLRDCSQPNISTDSCEAQVYVTTLIHILYVPVQGKEPIIPWLSLVRVYNICSHTPFCYKGVRYFFQTKCFVVFMSGADYSVWEFLIV